MFKRISIFLIVVLTILAFTFGASATIFVVKDVGNTYIDYQKDGESIFTIGEDLITISAPVLVSGTVTHTGSAAVTITGGVSSPIAYTGKVLATVAYTGSAAGVFGTVTLSATSGITYSAFGGCFDVNIVAGYAANQAGLVVGAYVGAYSKNTIAPTTCLFIEAIPGGVADFSEMPLMILTDSGDGVMPNIAIEFGSEVAGKYVSYTDVTNMYYHDTIRVRANADDRWIPLSTVAGTFTTEYPVAISNLVTIAQPTPDLAGETNLLDIEYVTGIAFPGVTHKGLDIEMDHTAAYAGGNLVGAFIKLALDTGGTISGLTTPLYCAIDAGASTSLGTAYALVLEYSDDGDKRVVKPTGFIRFGDKDTDAATQVGLLFDIGAQNAMPVGTAAGQIYYNDTLRIVVNADTRFIPLSSEEGTYTTDYPIVSTYSLGIAIDITTTTATTGLQPFVLDATYTGDTGTHFAMDVDLLIDAGTGTSFTGDAGQFTVTLDGAITGMCWASGLHAALTFTDEARYASSSGIYVALNAIVTADASAVFTNGHIAVLRLATDMGKAMNTTGGIATWIYIDQNQQHAAGSPDSVMLLHSWDTPYLFDVPAGGSSQGIQDTITSSATTPVGHLKIRFNGADCYINVFGAVSDG